MWVKSQTLYRIMIWKSEQRDLVRRSSILRKEFREVGAGTSVGANYIEADDSVSKKEFLKCIGTCKKEARETKHFLVWSPAQFLSCRLTHESSGWKRGHYI